MAFANNKGVKIRYEVEGEGEPIVLMHGFSGNLQGWVNIPYKAALVPNHLVISVDARGHGRSDKPHDPAAYDIETKVEDVICILNDLDIHRAHYWGYSMGGLIGLGVATFGSDRFKSVVAGGTAPGPRDPSRYEKMAQQLAGGMDAYLEQFPRHMRPRFAHNDAEALRATALATMNYPVMNLEAPLAPCLIYNGTEDPVIEQARAMANKTSPSVHYAEIPGVDHAMCFQRSDLVLPVVLPFLSRAARGEVSLAR